MSSVWRFVNQLQATLDEAAGIDTVVTEEGVDEEYSDENDIEGDERAITNEGYLVNSVDNLVEAVTEPLCHSVPHFASSVTTPIKRSEGKASTTIVETSSTIVPIETTLHNSTKGGSNHHVSNPTNSTTEQIGDDIDNAFDLVYSDDDICYDTCEVNCRSNTAVGKEEYSPSLVISSDDMNEYKTIQLYQKQHSDKCITHDECSIHDECISVSARDIGCSSNNEQSVLLDAVAARPVMFSQISSVVRSDEPFKSENKNEHNFQNDDCCRQNDNLIAQLTRLQQHLAAESRERSILEEKSTSQEEKVQKLLSKNKRMQEKLIEVQKKAKLDADAKVQEVINDGIKLSKELAEEQQLLKRAIERTRTLERDLDVAQEEIDRFQRKEVSWEKERKIFMNSDTELRSNVTQFTAEIEKRDNLIEGLNKQICNLKSILESTKSEAYSITSDMEALTKVQAEEHAIVVNNLHAEVYQLKHQLQRQAMDYDLRLTSAEQEVTDANNRVIMAERRTMEAGQSVEDSTMELRNELRQALQQINRLQELLSIRAEEKREMERELSKKSLTAEELLNELEVKRRQWTNEKEGMITKILESERTIMILREVEIEALRKKNASLKEIISSMQKQLENRSVNSPSPQQPPQSSPLGKSCDKVATPVTVSAGNGRITDELHKASQELSMSSEQRPYIENDLAHSSSSTRAQKELIRVTMELLALKTKYKDTQRSLDRLYKQHDLLLQMYGEREEELSLTSGRTKTHSGDRDTKDVVACTYDGVGLTSSSETTDTLDKMK